MDIVRAAPTVLEITRAARTGARPRGKRVEAWDAARWPLDGLQQLVDYWSPLYEATPRAAPGDELIAKLRAEWDDLSYERRFFERRLDEARSLPMGTLFRDEAAALQAEVERASDGSDLAQFLLGAVTDWMRVKNRQQRGGRPAVRMPEPAKGVWVMQNVAALLMTHWALRHAHGDLVPFLRKRDAALDAALGSTSGSADLSSTHDDTD